MTIAVDFGCKATKQTKKKKPKFSGRAAENYNFVIALLKLLLYTFLLIYEGGFSLKGY